MDTTVYYFYFDGAVFEEEKRCFARWSNWKRYHSASLRNDPSEVEKHNLKLFLPNDFDGKRLRTIVKVMEAMDFRLVAELSVGGHRRMIFEYEKLSKSALAVPMSPNSHIFIEELVDKMVTLRRKVITVFPNRYENAGYFTRKDATGKIWRFPCRQWKHVLYWFRHYAKHHPDQEVAVYPATFVFVENELLPGGRWINEEDGSETGNFFYRPPDETIEYSATFLKMSDGELHLDSPATTGLEMIRFHRMDDDVHTGRQWVSLPTCIMARAERLQRMAEDHVSKYVWHYEKRKFEGTVTLERQNVLEHETVVDYRVKEM